MRTLAEARRYVEAQREQGVICPCCDQLVRVYRRKLNVSMARSIIWLVREWIPGADSWVNVTDTAPKWLLRSRELPKLVYWQLAEERPRVGASPSLRGHRAAGYWRPTKRGIDFVMRRVRIPMHVFVLNNRVVRLSDLRIDIVDALGAKFVYEDLMR